MHLVQVRSRAEALRMNLSVNTGNVGVPDMTFPLPSSQRIPAPICFTRGRAL